MIILICCIVILITYIVLFGLLTYYFIKYRTLWNELFSIDKIVETLTEIFACPEHFIIYIPGILFESTPCLEKSKEKYKVKEKIRRILTKINTIFKKMESVGLESDSIGNDSIGNDSIGNDSIDKMKWILGSTMENFTYMYEETADFYNNLSGSYKILNDTNEKKNKKEKDNTKVKKKEENNTQHLMTLEKIVIIENNIEHCNTILQLLELIYVKDFETLFQIENKYYMLCLIYNLIESIRLYKIRLYKISF